MSVGDPQCVARVHACTARCAGKARSSNIQHNNNNDNNNSNNNNNNNSSSATGGKRGKSPCFTQFTIYMCFIVLLYLHTNTYMYYYYYR